MGKPDRQDAAPSQEAKIKFDLDFDTYRLSSLCDAIAESCKQAKLDLDAYQFSHSSSDHPDASPNHGSSIPSEASCPPPQNIRKTSSPLAWRVLINRCRPKPPRPLQSQYNEIGAIGWHGSFHRQLLQRESQRLAGWVSPSGRIYAPLPPSPTK
jgi:hypothetical protein